LIENTELNLEDYIQKLANTETRLKLIDASLKPSYESLDAELQRLWCELSMLSDTFDKSAAAKIWAIEPDSANDALSELMVHSLVEWHQFHSSHRRETGDEGAEEGYYRLHDLARLFANAHLSEADRIHNVPN